MLFGVTGCACTNKQNKVRIRTYRVEQDCPSVDIFIFLFGKEKELLVYGNVLWSFLYTSTNMATVLKSSFGSPV